MNPERWRKIRPLFESTLTLPTDYRESHLRDLCGDDSPTFREVWSMLQAADEAGSFIEQPLLSPERQADDETATLEPGGVAPDGLITDAVTPGRIGAYEIERLLGQGGMGKVYLAHRADRAYEKKVAIKVLKGGLKSGFPDSVRHGRFRGERQILAQLDHPSIAHLLDGGTTDQGQPYLVMDYVEGRPIDRFCSEQRLSVTERLRLFLKVCDAVHFAHQNLIVHRDLKPANILVTDAGEPKLLDFGIAKLLNPGGFPLTVEATAEGQWLLTPEYASPEQVKAEPITTASDVYSLGVLLYELLAGQRPYKLTSRHPTAVLQAVCGTAPERPSAALAPSTPAGPAAVRRLRRQLVGDLDNIVLMALRKEPRRRYASALQLSRDLERHLEGRPVVARPDTGLYRASKFVRRHRAVVALTTLLVAALVSFLVVLLVQRGEVLAQSTRARAVSDFMINLFTLPDPVRARGETVTARQLLDQGRSDIESRLAGQDEARAEMLAAMAETYKNLGFFDEAQTLAEQALELRRELYGQTHLSVATSLRQLAHLHSMAGNYGPAEDLGRQALELFRRRRPPGHTDVVESLYILADTLELRGDYAAAAEYQQEALQLARAPGRPELLATVLDRHARLLTQTGDHDKARRLFDEAMEIYHRLDDATHPELPSVTENRALLEARHDPRLAEELMREALKLKQRLLGEDHPSLAHTLANLAFVVSASGRLDEAETLYEKSLALQRELYGGDHPRIAATLNNLGELRYTQDRLDEAETLYQEAWRMQRQLLGDDHSETARTLQYLGRLASRRGRLDEAEAFYNQALSVVTARLGADHSRAGVLLSGLGSVAHSRDKLDIAEDLYRRSIAVCRRALGKYHPDLVYGLHNLGTLLEETERPGEARDHYNQALEAARAGLASGHHEIGMLLTRLARIDNKTGEYAKAEVTAREAAPILENSLGEGSLWTAAARRALGVSLLRQGRHAEAELYLVSDHERMKALRGPDWRLTVAARERLVDLYESWGRIDQAAEYR